MENLKNSATLKIAWILMLGLGALITVGGLESLYVAYWGFGDAPAQVQLSELAKVNPELPLAIRGRRATAASLAVTCGLLLTWIAVTAYRRAEKWAWYALLVSLGIGSVLSLLRILVLGSKAGVSGPGFALLILLVALILSYRDFKG